MNTLSIAPQLMMNVLQNMNIKRDTLEKRAIVKSQFQETTTGNSNHADADAAAAAASTAPVDYESSSIETQYLPKSLRGTNPYSIMNEMTEHVVPSTSSLSTASSTDNNIVPADLETSIASAAIVSTNEVIIQSPESLTNSGL